MLLADLHDAIVSDCNKHDQVTVLIEACIGEGIDTRRAIADAIAALDYNRKYVIIILNHNTGPNPERHRWWRDGEGRYRMHHQSE